MTEKRIIQRFQFMGNQLSSQYNPREVEDKIYKKWESGGYFKPEIVDNLKSATRKEKKKNFSIIMPPPNANGSMHLGHAVFVTLEDIMIRYHRMLGEKTLWLPGADHAGFETQVVYQKKLEKEDRNWFTIPREQLYKEISDFTLANKSVMENQLRRLGASCDWSREIFTLDERIIRTVYQTFKKLYDDGLIYRGTRIVNWCPKHQTTLSDLEIKHVERQDPLYYIKYGPITLATVRLETKFGDTAVAVNPKDKRYKKFIGQEIEITTLLGPTKIKVIADEAVDMKFGTGAVKVTPAHDPNDFDMWQRHKAEMSEPWAVIDQFGKMDLLSRWPNNERAKKYHGLKILEARKMMAEDMQAEGLMEKIDETYTHSVATCYKCGQIVEPRIMPQWYVAMTREPKSGGLSLRDAAVKAVKKGEVKFVTKKFEKIFTHWMKNLRDWNISRQIVWGIRMPVWYHPNVPPLRVRGGEEGLRTIHNSPQPSLNLREGENVEVYVGTEPPKGDGWTQETDVFDTWFSSGQWPFATLQATGDFKKFYPTSVMETGWDILFFWVARMIMMGLYASGKVPFKHVYLHGLVRDKDRQKMSKSKGNVIDPLGVVDLYGADALRMALVFGVSAGNDIVISEDKIKAHRNFANKIWNASRFVMMNLDGLPIKPKLTPADKKVLNKLQSTVKEITKYLEKFDFNHAGEIAYHYFWHTFCDKIIEEQKTRLGNGHASSVISTEPKVSGEISSGTNNNSVRSLDSARDDNERRVAQYLLYIILTTCLKLLHPFMPFVTEAVWQELPKEKDSMLIVEPWPYFKN